jgi:cytochrome c5
MIAFASATHEANYRLKTHASHGVQSHVFQHVCSICKSKGNAMTRVPKTGTHRYNPSRWVCNSCKYREIV